VRRPVLIDAFCCAGGATKGYQRAGFYVIGVDKDPQPNYCGDEFVQADALEFLASDEVDRADAVHASPPCQNDTAYKRRPGHVRPVPALIDPTRDLLDRAGLRYVIENVPGAPLLEPVVLCGSMFDPPLDVQRHRLFETNWTLDPPLWPCRHKLWGPDRYPGGRSKERTGSSRGASRKTVEIGTWDIPLDVQSAAIGIDWMTVPELSQSIPPAYTEFIGEQLLRAVSSRELAA